jgi:hypothetical protein
MAAKPLIFFDCVPQPADGQGRFDPLVLSDLRQDSSAFSSLCALRFEYSNLLSPAGHNERLNSRPVTFPAIRVLAIVDDYAPRLRVSIKVLICD